MHTLTILQKEIPFIITMITIAGIMPVFAQVGEPINPNTNVTTAYQATNHSVTVSTEKQSYVTNDMIIITGTGDPTLTTKQYLTGITTPVISKIPIAIRIFDSAGNICGVKQVDLDDIGKYSTTILASDNWKSPGLYTVIAQQGTGNKAQTQFWFNYNGGSIPNQQSVHTTTSSVQPLSATPFSITPSIQSSNSTSIPTTSVKIPNWVKSVFGHYAQGDLSDNDLIKALQFLIQQGIIKLS